MVIAAAESSYPTDSRFITANPLWTRILLRQRLRLATKKINYRLHFTSRQRRVPAQVGLFYLFIFFKAAVSSIFGFMPRDKKNNNNHELGA